MQSAHKVLLLAIAILFAHATRGALPTASVVLQVKPKYQFNTIAGAELWGKRVAVLQDNYTSSDPIVAADAKLQVDTMAAQFQRKYNKKWGPNEAPSKMETFTKNLWKISEINRNSRQTKWYAALTEFADMTSDEFARKYLMNNFKTPKKYDVVINKSIRLSTGWDWSAQDKVTVAKNQYACGSCWAMAAVAALESRYLIKHGLNASSYNLNLSEQQLLDCVTPARTSTTGSPYNSGGCGGGWSTDAFDYVRKYNVTMEEYYPYMAVNGVCKQRVLVDGKSTKVLKQSTPNPGYYQVTSNNVTAIKAATKYTPTVFYMRVEGDFHLYSGGVYTTPCTGTNLNHAMLIYGWYNPILIAGTPYWLIRNSWGTGWGTNGKAKIQMIMSGAGINTGLCGMHQYTYYPNENSMLLPLSLVPGGTILPTKP